MAKGIIVLDVPDCCGDCSAYDWKKHRCKIVGDGECKPKEHRQENCPIRPLPKTADRWKGKTETVRQWCDGWNACIDEIMKEDKEE